MDNIILFLVFVLIVLIGFFIYKIYIKSENFSTTETTLSSSGIQLVKHTLAVISPNTFRKYFTNYSTTESTNIYKKGLDYYLTLFTDQKKTSSPFRDSNPEPNNIIPINDVILEIIRTGKLNNYSDELRNIIICTYLSVPNVSKDAPENVSIKNFADSNKICPTEVQVPPKNTSWPLYASSFFTLVGAVSLGFYIYSWKSEPKIDTLNMTRPRGVNDEALEAYKSQLYLDASNTSRPLGFKDEPKEYNTFTGKDFAGAQNARVNASLATVPIYGQLDKSQRWGLNESTRKDNNTVDDIMNAMTSKGIISPQEYNTFTGKDFAGVQKEYNTFTGKDFAGEQNARMGFNPKVPFNPKLQEYNTFTDKDFAGVQNARVDFNPKVPFNPKLIETNNLTNEPLKYSNLNQSEAYHRENLIKPLSKRTNVYMDAAPYKDTSFDLSADKVFHRAVF